MSNFGLLKKYSPPLIQSSGTQTARWPFPFALLRPLYSYSSLLGVLPRGNHGINFADCYNHTLAAPFLPASVPLRMASGDVSLRPVQSIQFRCIARIVAFRLFSYVLTPTICAIVSICYILHLYSSFTLFLRILTGTRPYSVAPVLVANISLIVLFGISGACAALSLNMRSITRNTFFSPSRSP